MRRLLIAFAALSLLAATGPRPEPLRAGEDCTDYCGEKAAEDCDDLESFSCGFYIFGCLAGCNIAKIV